MATTSLSFMSFFAHCMIPAPMKNAAGPNVTPVRCCWRSKFRRTEPEGRVGRNHHVCDNERHGEDGRQREHDRDLAFGSLSRPRIEVRAPWVMVRKDDVAVRLDRSCLNLYIWSVLFTHRTRAPIHTAAPISRPMPMIR